LDVHAASSTVAVVSQTGKRLKDFRVEASGRALIEAVRMVAGSRHLILEEGTQSGWLHELLSPHVDELVVTGVVSSRGQKNDRRDAYALAEKLRIGAVDRAIFKAPRSYSTLRALTRTHSMIGRDLVRVQQRLKSIFRSRGLRTPGKTVYGARAREQWLGQLPAASARGALRLYEQHDFLCELKKQADAEVREELDKHPIARVLRTVPGMGAIRVARLLPIVVTPHRFRTKRQFWSYCGLGIVMRSSSDWIQSPDGGWIRAEVKQTRGLTRYCNRDLKEIFKGAATTVITQSNKGPL
jgi:transposase